MTTTTRTEFDTLLADAHRAGKLAMEAATPTPMVVYEADGLTDEPKPGGKEWYVPQGACGFAWVTLRPATTPLARHIRKTRFELGSGFGTYDRSVKEADGGSWGKGYYGGYQFWVWGGGQSVELKSAYATAYAEVLEAAGYNAYAQSRLD